MQAAGLQLHRPVEVVTHLLDQVFPPIRGRDWAVHRSMCGRNFPVEQRAQLTEDIDLVDCRRCLDALYRDAS